MRILVTGITGTVGGNLFRKLNENPINEVWGLSKSNYMYSDLLIEEQSNRIVCADLTNPIDSLAIPDNFDIVIHAASVTNNSKDKIVNFGNNLLIARNLAAFLKSIKVTSAFFLSTGSVYSAGKGSCDESTETNSGNDYGKSLLEAEQIVSSEIASINILRLFYVYGYDRSTKDNTLVSRFKQKIRNEEMIAVSANAGEAPINPLFFADIINVINVLYEKKVKGEVFNVAGPSTISFLGMIELIAANENKKANTFIDSKLADPLIANISKISKIIPKQYFTEFAEGIKFNA